jgi:hypothetical protein
MKNIFKNTALFLSLWHFFPLTYVCNRRMRKTDDRPQEELSSPADCYDQADGAAELRLYRLYAP